MIKLPKVPRNLIEQFAIPPVFLPIAQLDCDNGNKLLVSAMYCGTEGSLVKTEWVDEDGDVFSASTAYVLNVIVVQDEDGHFVLYDDSHTSREDGTSVRAMIENGNVEDINSGYAYISEDVTPEEDPDQSKDLPVVESDEREALKAMLEEDDELLEQQMEEEEGETNDEPESTSELSEEPGREPEPEEGGNEAEDDNVRAEDEQETVGEEQEELTAAEIQERMIKNASGGRPALPNFGDDEPEEKKEEPALKPEEKKEAPIQHDTTYVEKRQPEQLPQEAPAAQKTDYAAKDLNSRSQRPENNTERRVSDEEIARRRAEWKKGQEKNRQQGNNNDVPKKHFIDNRKQYQPKPEQKKRFRPNTIDFDSVLDDL
jgi:hypothetical protein